MSRWFLVFALVLTIGVGCTGLLTWDRWMLASSTAREGDVGVWVYNPHLAPGDTLVTTVGVYSGLEVGISEVHVQAGDQQLQVRGSGATWGGRLVKQSTSKGNDSLEVEVAIPPDLPVGSVLPLTFDVHWIAARSSGFDTFANDHAMQTVRVDLPIRSSGQRVVRRVGSTGFALGGLLLAALAWVGVFRLVAVAEEDGSSDDTEALVGALVIGLIAYGFVGYWLFVLPMLAGIGLTGMVFAVAMLTLWVVAPPLVAYRLEQRVMTRPKLFVDLERPIDPVAWLERLERGGVRIVRLPFVARVGEGPLAVWLRPGQLRRPGRTTLYGSSEEMAVRLALDLAGMGGAAVRLTSHGTTITVHPGASQASVLAALMQARERAIAEMMAQLDRMSDLFRKLDP